MPAVFQDLYIISVRQGDQYAWTNVTLKKQKMILILINFWFINQMEGKEQVAPAQIVKYEIQKRSVLIRSPYFVLLISALLFIYELVTTEWSQFVSVLLIIL